MRSIRPKLASLVLKFRHFSCYYFRVCGHCPQGSFLLESVYSLLITDVNNTLSANLDLNRLRMGRLSDLSISNRQLCLGKQYRRLSYFS